MGQGVPTLEYSAGRSFRHMGLRAKGPWESSHGNEVHKEFKEDVMKSVRPTFMSPNKAGMG